MVWVDQRAGNWDIYAYDLSTAIEFPICTTSSGQTMPSIHGNKIVWADDRNGNLDIYGYDLSTSTEFPICVHAGKQDLPSVSGDLVVWRDDRNGNDDIFGFDMASSTEFTVCADSGDQKVPRISGNTVVWSDNRNGNGDIYGCDLTTMTVFPICVDSSNQSSCSIHGNIVAWWDYRNGNGDIYGFDLGTSVEFPICTDSATQQQPYVCGDIVLYQSKQNGNYDIYGFEISTGLAFPVCTDPEYQSTPAMHDNTIVWRDSRNGQADIYALRIGPQPPADLAGSFPGETVHLVWSPNPEPFVIGYNIYRNVSGSITEFEWIDSVSHVSTSYDDNGFTPFRTNLYKITALIETPLTAESEYSATVHVKTGLALSIGDVRRYEGDWGTRSFDMVVSLSESTDQSVTVDFATMDGTATAGSDYSAASGTVLFSPGETAKTVTVIVFGDRIREGDETFFVDLSNPSGPDVTLTDARGTGTIVNDERKRPISQDLPPPG